MMADIKLVPTGKPNEFDIKRGATWLARVTFLGQQVLRCTSGYLYPKEKAEAIRLYNERV